MNTNELLALHRTKISKFAADEFSPFAVQRPSVNLSLKHITKDHPHKNNYAKNSQHAY